MNGDTWTEVLYDGMRVTPLAAPFFVVLYGIGSIVLLRLFTGVLLDKFSQVPDKVVVNKSSGEIKLIEDHVGAAAEEELSDVRRNVFVIFIILFLFSFVVVLTTTTAKQIFFFVRTRAFV